jgi:hypothetical protein
VEEGQMVGGADVMQFINPVDKYPDVIKTLQASVTEHATPVTEPVEVSCLINIVFEPIN